MARSLVVGYWQGWTYSNWWASQSKTRWNRWSPYRAPLAQVHSPGEVLVWTGWRGYLTGVKRLLVVLGLVRPSSWRADSIKYHLKSEQACPCTLFHTSGQVPTVENGLFAWISISFTIKLTTEESFKLAHLLLILLENQYLRFHLLIKVFKAALIQYLPLKYSLRHRYWNSVLFRSLIL